MTSASHATSAVGWRCAFFRRALAPGADVQGKGCTTGRGLEGAGCTSHSSRCPVPWSIRFRVLNSTTSRGPRVRMTRGLVTHTHTHDAFQASSIPRMLRTKAIIGKHCAAIHQRRAFVLLQGTRKSHRASIGPGWLREGVVVEECGPQASNDFATANGQRHQRLWANPAFPKPEPDCCFAHCALCARRLIKDRSSRAGNQCNHNCP